MKYHTTGITLLQNKPQITLHVVHDMHCMYDHLHVAHDKKSILWWMALLGTYSCQNYLLTLSLNVNCQLFSDQDKTNSGWDKGERSREGI